MTDVCLILEGTYPYVAGGVASWVNDLMCKLSDTTFSVVYLGAPSAKEKKMYYSLPENVYDFCEIDMFNYSSSAKGRARNRNEDFKIIEQFIWSMSQGDTSYFDQLLEIISDDEETRRMDIDDLAYAPESWSILERTYRACASEHSFIDFFWTWRALYFPFLNLLNVRLPKASVYHSISTGYAGVLGAIAQRRFRRPFLLTEHGIYTRERKIDIAQADWIHSPLAKELKVVEENDFFKDWWTRAFMFMSRLAYERADEIITLFEGNRKTQIEEGANPYKTRVIPNGVNLPTVSVPPRGPQPRSLKIGFVGRVVPIKDVKTFITACQSIYAELKNVEFYIMGPTDEDEEYFRECVLLTKMKSLENVVHFTGNVQLCDYYPQLDVVVLTSVSESQPLVILEASAYGIPVVATDVGACSELIFGRCAEDQSLGASGIITSICSPHETAHAVLKILKDSQLRAQMGAAGKNRATLYYRQDDFLASYQMLYNRYMGQVYA